MQVVEKPGEGLSRNYGVLVPATELGAALDAKIAEILPTLSLKGFRPGKVPQAHVRRLYGKALMGEVIEKTITETSQQVLADHQLRIAARPDLKPVSDMDQVIAGREDLAYDLEVEVMPEFEPTDVSALTLTRLVYKPTPAELAEALADLVAQNRTYEARAEESARAEDGDQVVVDFLGRIDGEPFEGGAATDAEMVLGAGRFIPGFEEQLVGAAPGEALTVNVTFPADYGAAPLAGKAAVFDVTVKEVRAPQQANADDELAQRLGLTNLAALTDAVRSNMERQYDQASRFKLKRALLDALDERHAIPLPPRMVDAEFAGIWSQVEKDKAEGQDSPEDAGKSDEELRAEYRRIAERRVRLGLVLAEIGRRENVTVSEAEVGDAMRAEAMRYGEQAQQMFDMMRQSQEFRSQMQAPLYEEKVVDLILGRATVNDEAVSKEELLREDDLPEGYAADEEPAKAAKAGKTPKRATAKAGHSTSPVEEPPASAPMKKAKAGKAEKEPAEEETPPVKAKSAAKPKAAKVVKPEEPAA